MIGCTTVTASYAAYARALAEAWLRFHPHLPFCVLLLDGDASALAGDGFRVITAEELDLPSRDLQIRRGIYDPFELSTSLKAHLLKKLIAAGYDAVVFLDSDTGIYGSLGEVGIAAAKHGVALSPHVLQPPPRDGEYPSEVDILKYGLFNSGFIAVGAGAGPFLEWWSDHVRRDCIDDLASGLHVDQYWLQSVPLYFEHTVLRDPTLHVAHWNVHERALEFVQDRFLVNGEPLRTFHFSGFDPERPEQLQRYPTRVPYRAEAEGNPALLRLLRDYSRTLIAAGHRESRQREYVYARSASGLPLGRWERAVYREAILAWEAGKQAEVPDPFDPADSAAFARLVASPGSRFGLSRQAMKRLRDARKVFAEHDLTPTRTGQLAARGRRFIRHRLIGSEQGLHVASDRTALEYDAVTPAVEDG